MLLSPRLRRHRNRRPSPRRGGDAGNTHVLEAVIVVSIMLSAVVFVVTYDQPGSAAGQARDDLSMRAGDALKLLADTPVTSKFGDTALSAFIAECMNGGCDNLTSRLAKLVPAGASYALYVSNGYDTYPVLIEGAPSGEAATASLAFEPRWSNTFVSTATDSIGADDPLLVYALPIYHSNALTPGGSQLLVKMSGKRVDGSDYVLTGSYTTVSQDDPAAVAASLVFVDEGGVPLPVHNISGLAGPQRITLRLNESEGGTIPAGAEVGVHVPRGWTARAPPAENAAWDIIAQADDPDGAYSGSTVRASLKEALTGPTASRDLLLDLTYHGDLLDYYGFVATMSRGATGIASMVVRGEVHDDPPIAATPMLHMSVPNPMGNGGAQTTWTLSAYIPATYSDYLPGYLSDHIRVESIEILEQEGNPIFGGVEPIGDAMGGSWTSSPGSLVWKGSVDLHYEKALNLSFLVRGSGTAGPQEARAPFIPPVTFDTFTGRLAERTGWGFYRQAILPENVDYAGHQTSVTSATDPHSIASQSVYRQTRMNGTAHYGVETVGGIEDSLYGSYVVAEKRSVPIGGEVVINANVQSILFTLAELGQKAGVTLRFYGPWSGDDRSDPVYEQPNLDQGLLSGEVSQMIAVDMNGDGYPDPVVGTTNGRVIAYHAMSGQRLQGNTYNVPVSDLASQQKTFPKITALMPIKLYGEEYIVVGTDRNSDGIFVLSKDFNTVWRYRFGNADVLAIDSQDMDGDGQPEIIVARAHEVGAAKNTLVYVLKAVVGATSLIPIASDLTVTEDQDAFYYSLGTPTAILGQSNVGPFGEGPGVLVPIQTLVDPGLRIDTTVVPPVAERGSSSTPRAGLQGVDENGIATSTLFGAPASVLRNYDYDSDGINDVVFGGASGYVVMANGSALTQPLYSYVFAPSTPFIDADTRSSAETYALTEAGDVLWTDDGWIYIYAPSNSAPGAKGLAANGTNSYWVVGEANQVWKSVSLLGDPPDGRHPASRELVPVVMAPTRNLEPYDLATQVHELRDVWFRGDDGWIVGTVCPLTCTEPIVLRTADAGATWKVLSTADDTLVGVSGDVVQNLSTIEFFGETGWIVGEGGTLLRKASGSEVWQQIDLGTTYHLHDIACKPGAPSECMAVGDAGAAFATTDGTTWVNVTGLKRLPTDRPLHTIGFVEDDRVYIGSANRVLASFQDSAWTAMPLNYIENDAYVISTTGDGTGYAYGGSDVNGRIWLLHDYHIRSSVQTVDLAPLIPNCTRILAAALTDSNVSIGLQTIDVDISFNGSTFHESDRLGPLVEGSLDSRQAQATDEIIATNEPFPEGCSLVIRIGLTTSGASTIISPHVRAMKFTIDYFDPDLVQKQHVIELDFTTQAQIDPLYETTAAWDTKIKALRQPFVEERWTRNVSGQVYDLQTGFDATADGVDDVWAGTGDVLAENSPDYIIYAGTDTGKIIGSDNRVYLLDGRNGDIVQMTAPLDGEVRHLRLADIDDDGKPEVLYALTWNVRDDNGVATLYAFDPFTLALEWSQVLGREIPSDIELGKVPGDPKQHGAVFIGTTHAPDAPLALGHLYAYNGTTELPQWRVMPDDLGRYLITTAVEPWWLFGAHVVEVEVEWEETVTKEGNAGEQVLRSARFYDHFVVTPPDLVSPPTPVYTARLLVWMQDWA